MDKYEYYVAYDGKRFDCLSDCEDYELNKLREYLDKKEIRFLNEDLEDQEKSKEDPVTALEESAAVYIKNREAYKVLLAIADYYGMSIPPRAGFWDYDASYGWKLMWSVLDEEARYVHKKIEKYNKIIREGIQLFEV